MRQRTDQFTRSGSPVKLRPDEYDKLHVRDIGSHLVRKRLFRTSRVDQLLEVIDGPSCRSHLSPTWARSYRGGYNEVLEDVYDDRIRCADRLERYYCANSAHREARRRATELRREIHQRHRQKGNLE